MFKMLRILLLIVASCNTAFADVASISAQKKPISNKPDIHYLQQMQTVFNRIKSDYVQEPDLQQVTDEAIDGMLKSLDPYCGYYVDEDLEFFKDQTDGEFGGIGIEMTYDDKWIKVVTPIDDLPAQKAGIEPGDYIIGVNGRLVSNIGFNKAVREIRGKPGTKLNLLIARKSDNSTKELELTREIVKIQPIKFEIEEEPNIGAIAYIRIAAFHNQTTDDLKKSIKSIQDQVTKNNSSLKAMILDLRNNPGGVLDQAVRMCEYFLEKGNIVSIKGKNPESNVMLSASIRAEKAPAVPIAVLINSGSASAAEIVAGALQDYHRAVIVGTTSFGKGLVQSFMQLDERSAVKLTTAKYYTPNGRSINAIGIIPDIEVGQEKVEFSQNKDNENSKFSEASIKSYLAKYNTEEQSASGSDAAANDDDKSEKIRAERVMSERYKKDYQYARAYDVVRGMILTGAFNHDDKK